MAGAAVVEPRSVARARLADRVLLAPGVPPVLVPAPVRPLPLPLVGQAPARPGAVGARGLPGHVHDRDVVAPPVAVERRRARQRAAGRLREALVRAHRDLRAAHPEAARDRDVLVGQRRGIAVGVARCAPHPVLARRHPCVLEAVDGVGPRLSATSFRGVRGAGRAGGSPSVRQHDGHEHAQRDQAAGDQQGALAAAPAAEGLSPHPVPARPLGVGAAGRIGDARGAVVRDVAVSTPPAGRVRGRARHEVAQRLEHLAQRAHAGAHHRVGVGGAPDLLAERLRKTLADVETAVLELLGPHRRRHRRRREPGLHRERALGGERLVEALPERVDVDRARVRPLAAEDLRRQVRKGPHVSGGGERAPGLSHRDAEVHELHSATAAQDDVGRLDVAVEDPRGVRVLEGGGERRECGQRLREGERAPLQTRLERLAMRQLHGQVGQPPHGVLADGHHAHDGGMAERAQRLRLAHEPRARLRVGVGLEHLERGHHAVTEHRVDAVDGAHAALSEAVVDHPVADPVAGAQHGRGWTPSGGASTAARRTDAVTATATAETATVTPRARATGRRAASSERPSVPPRSA